jgi:predicted DNA-binding protein (MmcQ/YjbR family)
VDTTSFEGLRALLLARPGAVEDFPFGPDALVARVGGKMFAILSASDDTPRLSLKVEPEHGELLRGAYPAIQPGYHLNKRHWITLTADGSVPADLVGDLIDDSYELVLAGLSRAVRERIRGQQ